MAIHDNARIPADFRLARGLDQDLERFLRQPQRGSRRVAKELLRPVQRIRHGQFAGAAVMERAAPVTGALFENVPNDYGHFSVPYLAHMLCGLRAEVPSYVRDVLEGRTPPTWVTDHVGGIVVIPDADAPTTASPARAGDDGAGLLPPRYLFRGSARGPPAFGSGMTSPSCC